MAIEATCSIAVAVAVSKNNEFYIKNEELCIEKPGIVY